MNNKKRMKISKTSKQITGERGEDYAAGLLQDNGYMILRRNYSVHNTGEIDIIAEKQSDIYFFEVRNRTNRGVFPDSTESVVYSKRKRIMRTAEHYLSENGFDDRNVFFSIVKVTHDGHGTILNAEIIPF